MRNCVEEIIKDNIYGEFKLKIATQTLPQIMISFDGNLLDEYVGALKANQLVVDTFTFDSLKKK